MLRPTFGIASIFSLFAIAACAPEGHEPAAAADSNVVSVLPGSGIESPNANPTGAYLSSRSIANLNRLGALTGILARLAERTDGLLGTTEADGRLSVEELVAIERPGLVEKLFAPERQALPDLWRLLEITKTEPTAIELPAVEPIQAIDISEGATTPLEPTTIAVSSLRPELQRTLARLEALHDSDDDVTTVARADIEAALASPAVFQPYEIHQLKLVLPIFLERAGTKLQAKVRVREAAPVPSYGLPNLVAWGPVKLDLAKGVEYRETRTKDTTTGDLVVALSGHVLQRAVMNVPTPNQVLILDDGSDNETFAASGPLEAAAGTKTIEVWANGARVGSYRTNLPQLAPVDLSVDLTQFADYKFVFGDAGTALKRNYKETSAEGSTRFFARFEITKDGWDSGDASIAQAVATPAFPVKAGRYGIGGGVSVQIYPEGVLKVSRQDGWTERAIYRGDKWVLPSTSDLRFSYDAKTNRLVVETLDGTTIFSGPLTGAQRTG